MLFGNQILSWKLSWNNARIEQDANINEELGKRPRSLLQSNKQRKSSRIRNKHHRVPASRCKPGEKGSADKAGRQQRQKPSGNKIYCPASSTSSPHCVIASKLNVLAGKSVELISNHDPAIIGVRPVAGGQSCLRGLVCKFMFLPLPD